MDATCGPIDSSSLVEVLKATTVPFGSIRRRSMSPSASANAMATEISSPAPIAIA